MPARYSDRSVLFYVGTEIERMGESLDATEDTMVDGIQLCGDVLRAGYDYDSIDSVAGACFTSRVLAKMNRFRCQTSLIMLGSRRRASNI